MGQPRYEFQTVKIPKRYPRRTGRERDKVLRMYSAQGWEFVRKVRELWGRSEEVELRRALPSGDASPAGGSPGPSTADELTKLADLLARDLITRDEFDWQKQRVRGSSGRSGAYSVVLDAAGAGVTKIRVITEIRSLIGMGLKPAVALVDNTPSTLLSGVDHATAAQAQETLVGLGATARIVPAE
ncbi:ribosomal protein L7/L12 [Glycomyces sp. YM15]|uniref:ribosomal protein L7/L12 n=1 Tax=Glycomyces sp. YM15 TaxID=2800446 RepID=UPI001962D10D|nr:ribosomal protein L7/L12 [Glycomyces sp. YM15]